MKVTSNIKGQLAVSKTELRALELGFLPSRPLFDTRYDLIIDDYKILKRVQIKYADGKSTNSQGVVAVKLDYEDRQRNFKTYSSVEVDALIVYIPKIDRLCWLPLHVFAGKRRLYLRIAAPQNNQKRNIVYAQDYYW